MGELEEKGINMIRVMIVDDHTMVREGLKILLSTTDDLEVVGEAANGPEALRICASIQPDVVLMDIVMPGMDGVTTTGHLLEDCPGARVIALTSFADEESVERALEAGAISYLLKDASPQKLAQAIREAFEGRGSIDGVAMQALMRGRRDREQKGDWGLTPRELEVLALLTAGMSNKQIATQLTLSNGTVRLHVSNILAKLGTPNRTAAAMAAMQNGLV
jgi:NarL family two-component system response regulator LiaR